jgi:hypothetical protein
MRERTRFLYKPALVAFVALATAVTGATAASAATLARTSSAAPLYTCGQAFGCPYFSGNGIRIRSAPVSGTVYGLGYEGQRDALVEGECSGDVGGDYWWDYGTDTSTGITGWAADYYVSEFSQDVFGAC